MAGSGLEDKMDDLDNVSSSGTEFSALKSRDSLLYMSHHLATSILMSSLSMLASLPVYLQGFEPYIFVFPKIEEIKRSPNQEYTHNKCNLFDGI